MPEFTFEVTLNFNTIEDHTVEAKTEEEARKIIEEKMNEALADDVNYSGCEMELYPENNKKHEGRTQ